MNVHAGCVALWIPFKGWRGALIQGDSGSGKSDLALRTLDLGCRLVSDDRTLVWRSSARLFAACPSPIAGMIEARDVGLLQIDALFFAEVVLAVRCAPVSESLERLPEPDSVEICGGTAPLLTLHALEASAPSKLIRMLASLGAGAQPAYLAAAAEAAREGIPVRSRV